MILRDSGKDIHMFEQSIHFDIGIGLGQMLPFQTGNDPTVGRRARVKTITEHQSRRAPRQCLTTARSRGLSFDEDADHVPLSTVVGRGRPAVLAPAGEHDCSTAAR
jgi:hypothetical protein